jgi:hypothetical protein
MAIRSEATVAPPSSEDGEFEGLQFDAIAAAVAETPRGRWFLDEFARRTRATETERIEELLRLIESRLPSASPPDADVDHHQLAVSIQQRLLDLTDALRAAGASADVCARIESQAEALIDLARRRNLMRAAEMLEAGIAGSRKIPTA